MADTSEPGFEPRGVTAAVKQTTVSRQDTQWASQFFTCAELARRGYTVSLTLGNVPSTDLHVTSPGGHSFMAEVKGLRQPNFWLIRRPPERGERYYILVQVPCQAPYLPPTFYILTADEIRAVHYDGKGPGINWGAAKPHEDRWDKLPT